MIQYPQRGQPLFDHVKETGHLQCRALAAPLQVSFNNTGHTRDIRIGVVVSDDASIQITQDHAPEFVLTFGQATGRIDVTLCVLDTRKTNAFLNMITHLYSMQVDHPLTVESFFELYETTRKANQKPVVQKPLAGASPSPVISPPAVATTVKPVTRHKIVDKLKKKVQDTFSKKKANKR
jgi:hypothetical protein